MAVNGLNYTSGNELKFTTNDVTRGLVNASGNWGFGTLSPTSIVHISGATDPLTITGLQSGSDANILTIDGSGVVGTRGDIFVSASITDNVITFTDSDGSTSSLAAIDAITGLTIGSNVISYVGTGSFGADITVDALTSASYSDWGINASGTGTVSGNFELPFITGGSYNSGTDTLSLDMNGGIETSITITGFEGSDTYVTSGAINSPDSGTLRLTRNDAVNVDITGFQMLIAGDDDSSTLYMGDTFTIAGGNVITTAQNAGTVTINLDNTAVTAGNYGSASETVTLEIDAQGRITSASEQSISITASQVSDFDSEALSSIFEDANFVDSTEIDFTVTAGVSVTAGVKSSSITNDMLAGSIANDKLVNDSVTLGSTEITLGAAATTEINGLTSVTATTFTGALVGNASSATVLATSRDFSISGDITASAVSFDGSGNVVLSASIDSGVVTNDMLAGSISNDKLVNSGFNTAGTSGTGSIDLGDTITFASADGSVVISDNGSGTFDFSLTDGDDTFVTGSSYNAGTLTLTRNDNGTITQSGLAITLSDGSNNQTVNLGDTLTVVGGVGLTSLVEATDTVTLNLDNTTVSAGSYGAADTVATFTVDAQGRLTAASDVTIDIIASQVSDFATSAETAIFTSANFVDGTGIDFTVTAGASVSAGLTDTGVSSGSYGSSSQVASVTVDAQGRLTAASNVNIDGSAITNNTITFNGTTGSDPAIALNGTLDIISSDNSVSISGGTGTLDITIDNTNIDNIYTTDGTLTGARTVTQNSNSLSFTGGDFSVDGDTFNVNNTNNSVGIGVASANSSAVLEIASTEKGFLFPRMTETQRGSVTGVQGLMVYQTDGDEGIYIFKGNGIGWVQVI